jgi:hypothetical protein
VPVSFVDRLRRSTHRPGLRDLEAERQAMYSLVFPERIEYAPFDRILATLPWRNKGHWRHDHHTHLTIEAAHHLLGLQHGVTQEDLQRVNSHWRAEIGADLIWA